MADDSAGKVRYLTLAGQLSHSNIMSSTQSRIGRRWSRDDLRRIRESLACIRVEDVLTS